MATACSAVAPATIPRPINLPVHYAVVTVRVGEKLTSSARSVHWRARSAFLFTSVRISAAFRKEVLSKGGTADSASLYRAFRGRDPKVEPLLVKRGLK